MARLPFERRGRVGWPLAIAALLAAACIFSPYAQGALPVQQAAPDFTLRALNGPNLRLAEQRGKVVLVNFWATWCGPCRQEMPELEKLHRRYRASGFVLLGVNVDDDPAKAAELASRLGVTFPVLFDTDKAVSRRYDLATMPSTVIVDREGVVRHVHRGYQAGYERHYEQQVKELLK